MDNKQIFEMADELKAAKEHKKDLEAQVKDVNARIDELDKALSDAMAESELEKFTRNGSTFYLNSRLYASPRAEMKEAMFEALIAHGYGDLITQTVNANTLASFCKEQREANKDVIPDWLAAAISSPQITADKVQTTPSGDPPYVSALMRIWEMEEKINEEIDLYVDLKAQIHSVLKQVSNPDYLMVLRYRYIHNYCWEQIGEELLADRRTVIRWHDAAIKQLLVPENAIVI